jgi:hypothetical protein
MARTSEAFDEFAEDLLTERAVRPLVIVGASRVDLLLLEALRSYLLPKTSKPKEKDELLERDTGPLATFSSRIKICRRLGLIDETLFVTLEKLRSLRNASAHSVAFAEAESPIREYFAEFKKTVDGRKSYKLVRKRYFEDGKLDKIEEWQCLLLTVCVLLEAVRERVRQTSGNKVTMRISAN